MNVTIIDLETTGLDSQKDQVIELGFIIYSVTHQSVLQQFSTLLPVSENSKAHVNGINLLAANSIKHDTPSIAGWCSETIARTSYIVAHNAKFDSQWNVVNHFDIPWLCTYEDFIWPNNHQKTNLINTCLNHGVAVTKAHRALTDCQLIAELFDRADDLQGLFDVAIARSQEPLLTVVAGVNFDTKELARLSGFHWEPTQKHWFKQLKQSDIIKESVNWEFDYRVV